MLSRGVGLTSLQRVNLYPTVTPDPVTKVWRRRRTQVRGRKQAKLQFMQQKKLFIWDYALPVQIKRP